MNIGYSLSKNVLSGYSFAEYSFGVEDALIGIEMVGMVLSKNIPISFLVREKVAVQT